jgi:hypothetical protein
VFGIGLYLFSYNGLGLQHLWGEHVRVSEVLSPACVLLSALGAFLFIDRVLDIRGLSPRMSLVMHVCAGAAGVALVLLLTDVFGYRAAQQVAKLMGPLPMFLALPFAWMRWRQGDRAAALVFLGWALYAVGAVTMGRLASGQVAATTVTLHALQVGSLAEMLLWLLVMGLRVEQLRGAAEQATRDGDHLRHLAATDALTGLLNRAACTQPCHRCWRGRGRTGWWRFTWSIWTGSSRSTTARATMRGMPCWWRSASACAARCATAT